MPSNCNRTPLAGALRGPAAVVLPVILAALLAGCGPAVVGRGMSCKTLDEVPAALERENFSGTVLVVRRGQVLLERGFGQADRERQVPNGPETVYPIGSLTKLITATGIVKLSDERRLKLDDSLGLWLPGAPRLASLTLRQLLNHTSGLPDFSEAEVLRYQAAYPSSDSLVRVANSLKPGVKPGKSFAYSSWGYVLLGAVMERATGEPPADYLREAVLVPAGMTHAGFDARAYENPGRPSATTHVSSAYLTSPWPWPGRPEAGLPRAAISSPCWRGSRNALWCPRPATTRCTAPLWRSTGSASPSIAGRGVGSTGTMATLPATSRSWLSSRTSNW